MNKSERLHNQGDKEQAIAPELKLSTELWDTCMNLLDEKGRNTVNLEELTLQVLQPIGIIRSIAIRETPQDLVKQREIKLLPRDTKPYMINWLSIFIKSRGWDPSKAKIIEVHIPIMGKPMLNLTPMRYLKLVRQQRGKIMNGYPETYSYPDRHNLGGERLATMEELEAYQGYINKSSPIEHK